MTALIVSFSSAGVALIKIKKHKKGQVQKNLKNTDNSFDFGLQIETNLAPHDDGCIQAFDKMFSE